MVRCNSKWFAFLNLVFVLSFFMTPVIQSSLFAPGFGGLPITVTCKSLYGAQQGDTCSGITQKMKLDFDVFSDINPNLNCSAVFVGQWLCIDGVVN